MNKDLSEYILLEEKSSFTEMTSINKHYHDQTSSGKSIVNVFYKGRDRRVPTCKTSVANT